MTQRRLRLWAGLALLFPTSPLVAQASLEGTVRLRDQPAGGAVVWLVPRYTEALPVSADTVVIDQSRVRFRPRVVAVPLGGTVRFMNSDPIMHNVFSPDRRGADFDLGTYPQFESREHTFGELGSFVVLCHIHPEMSAWVVVTDSDLHDVADESGAFEIEAVMAGEYDVQIWHRGQSVSATIQVPEGGLEGLTLEVTRRN